LFPAALFRIGRANNPGLVIGLLFLIFTASVFVFFASDRFETEETVEQQRIPLPAGPRRIS
jgi:hypothetical protein